MSANPVTSWYAEKDWIEFKNSSGSTIPAYGILSLDGAEVGGGAGGGLVIKAKAPVSTGEQVDFINGPRPVAAGEKGLMTCSFPTFVKFDLSDAPSGAADAAVLRGVGWGPEASEFSARLAAGAALRMLVPTDLDNGIALFDRNPEFIVEGQLDASLSAGGSVTGNVYTRLGGSWGDANWTVQITDKAGWEGDEDYYFMAKLINNQWRPVVISCEAI